MHQNPPFDSSTLRQAQGSRLRARPGRRPLRRRPMDRRQMERRETFRRNVSPEATMPLKWMGKKDEAQAVARRSAGLVDIALDVEGEAKKELYKGHGVLTGALRRSIQAASPDYNWSGDDTLPGPGTAERGGARIEPVRKGDLLLVAIGSGLEYAMALHQG